MGLGLHVPMRTFTNAQFLSEACSDIGMGLEGESSKAALPMASQDTQGRTVTEGRG